MEQHCEENIKIGSIVRLTDKGKWDSNIGIPAYAPRCYSEEAGPIELRVTGYVETGDLFVVVGESENKEHWKILHKGIMSHIYKTQIGRAKKEILL